MPALALLPERACPEYGGLSQPALAGQLTGLGLPGVPAYTTTPWGGVVYSCVLIASDVSSRVDNPPNRAARPRPHQPVRPRAGV